MTTAATETSMAPTVRAPSTRPRRSSGSEKRQRNEAVKLGLFEHEKRALEAIAADEGHKSVQELIRHRLGPDIAEALSRHEIPIARHPHPVG